jgi:glycosyltransferase involved in cell wall biosynthesis
MRVQKIGICLMNLGHEVHLISNKITQFCENYATTTMYQSANQLRDAIKLHADADIFHAHNEPSWYVTAVKEIFPKKKIILDVHDSNLLRRTDEEVEEANDPAIFRHSVDEKNNMQLSDGLVYVCEPMREIVTDEYLLTQPNVVVPSSIPRQMFRFDYGIGYRKGLCYEGRIDVVEDLKKQWDFFSYCNYVPMAEKCAEKGIPFYIYTTRKDEHVRKVYGDRCFLAEPLEYTKLLRVISAHDWGLVGNLGRHPEWQHALPNKLFEYMAASLPIVCMNADHVWDFIKDTGMGIKVSSLDELIERWPEQRQCRKNVVARRMDYCLEKYIPGLEELYEKVLSNERPAVETPVKNKPKPKKLKRGSK